MINEARLSEIEARAKAAEHCPECGAEAHPVHDDAADRVYRQCESLDCSGGNLDVLDLVAEVRELRNLIQRAERRAAMLAAGTIYSAHESMRLQPSAGELRHWLEPLLKELSAAMDARGMEHKT